MVVLTDGPLAVVDRIAGLDGAAMAPMTRTKTCGYECGRTLPDDLEHFGPARRRKDGSPRTAPYCRDCKRLLNRRFYHDHVESRRAHGAEMYRRRMADPVRAERLRERDRERKRAEREAAKSDPELAARLRGYHDRWWARLKADPVRHAEYLENCRIARRLLEERRGRALDEQGAVQRKRRDAPRLEDDPRVFFDAAPFVEWLRMKRRANRLSLQAQADLLGVDRHRLAVFESGEQRNVSIAVVDGALTRWPHEILRVEDLYPELEHVELTRLAR